MDFSKKVRAPGSTAKVYSYHPTLSGKQFKIEGTVADLWGIQDPWMSGKVWSIPALSDYICTKPPYSGTVYYGHILEEVEGIVGDPISIGYCLHESHLED